MSSPSSSSSSYSKKLDIPSVGPAVGPGGIKLLLVLGLFYPGVEEDVVDVSLVEEEPVLAGDLAEELELRAVVVELAAGDARGRVVVGLVDEDFDNEVEVELAVVVVAVAADTAVAAAAEVLVFRRGLLTINGELRLVFVAPPRRATPSPRTRRTQLQLLVQVFQGHGFPAILEPLQKRPQAAEPHAADLLESLEEHTAPGLDTWPTTRLQGDRLQGDLWTHQHHLFPLLETSS